MRIILEIKAIAKNSEVKFNDGTQIELPQAFVSYKLYYNGKSIDETNDEILDECGKFETLELAKNLLLRKSYPSAKLKDKLSEKAIKYKFLTKDNINYAIEYLENRKFINNYEYANAKARQLYNRGKGESFIRSYLSSLKITKVDIDEAIKSLEIDDDFYIKILDKKFKSISKSETNKLKLKSKLLNFGVGRGISTKLIINYLKDNL